MSSIAGFAETFSNLATLDISNNELIQIRHVKALKYLDQLAELNFLENPITNSM